MWASARQERPLDWRSGLEKQVRRAIRLSTGRVPAEAEVKKDVVFARAAGLRQYCLLILNTNEFIYLD